jgi:hypothetical protein
MRRVVLDPEIVAAGILGDVEYNRFLGLLGFGRWAQYIDLTGPAEAAKLEEELLAHGGERYGASAEDLRDAARDRRAALADLLPYGAPDDLVLAYSRELRDEVVDQVQEARHWLPSAAAQPELGLEAHRIVTLLTGTLVEAAETVRPSLRDELIRVAAASSAVLVTDDEELVPVEYILHELTDKPTGRPAVGARWWTFLDQDVNQYPFDLAKVAPELLDTALL